MNNIFRMYGRVIQIYRYKAEYTVQQISSDGELEDIQKVGYFVSKDEAESTGGTVTALDTSACEWLDSIEVADVPDTYAEAVKIFEMGEDEYQKALDKPSGNAEQRLTALEKNKADKEDVAAITAAIERGFAL